MNSNKNTARTTGILLLLNFVIGVFINLFILGPLTFAADYLTKVSENPDQIIIAVLLYLTGAGIYVGIAAILLPVFKQISQTLALMFLGFSIISFTIISFDNLSILALLSISREYAKAVSPEADYLKALSSVFYAVRMWAHLLVILVGCVSLFIFYYLFYKSKLIPGFISACGLLGVLFMLTAVLMDIFGQGLYMLLFLPVGIIQIAAAIWLMAKGFKKPAIVSAF